MSKSTVNNIIQAIEQTTQQPFNLIRTRSIGGGCINETYVYEGSEQTYFVKLNHAHLQDMFAAEFEGLLEMQQTDTIRVPKPIVYGSSPHQAFLVLEKLDFSLGNHQSERQFGGNLAAMHQCRQDYFGWHRDNTIGSTPQKNPRSNDWVTFFSEHRLKFQLNLAAQKGYAGRLIHTGEKLAENLPKFFVNYPVQPSLLHGDLWSGNAATTSEDVPVIFDPACYYGDREADIAMTTLFGAFSRDFYAAYHDRWPLDDGYRTRKTLYNLYHILNHLNLFGSGYLHQAQNMIDQLLTEI
jgi:protein-ribulosamine 3-kinase